MIPKIIHASWKTKDILNDDSELIQKGLKQLVKLNPDWELQISDDDDVDRYLQEKLSAFDFALINKKHIVEKLDLWRLIKLYNEGGMYTDIDRLYNISIKDILMPDTKFVLPTCLDYDFSHDFMMTAPKNPIFITALSMNIVRRREGHDSIYYLGPQTWFHAVTQSLGYIKELVDTNPGAERFADIRQTMKDFGFITTYREHPPFDTILFRNETVSNYEQMKRDFYAKHNMKHWSGEW